ncbi:MULTISPECIES: hypothetical protein [Enterobacterales]|mgnify:CR=1 FL=1|jgi:hypothetical protein|uniref:Uncharacterized protein n=2 Tax=Enterobacter cloacae complex TaxID=354276 RepID=A0A837FJU9_9ENTR|nr:MULTISPECIES: hypothetical protein [Enterobacterales]EIB0106569.1 hypothetical protein [Escherichia coli]HBL5509554.1 hypothetical protein [Enterobacter hormaechei]HDT0316515.1 hypothetical protein [Citrobacter amalonaticus]HDW0120376.1 hypothetical protein [Enterobacter asburiae]HED1245116.1 hypothetical protein [Enterobacter bugandensis]
MSNDALMIASAILNLQQESSNFKDYIFPALTTSGSVLLGYLMANNTFAKQEIIKSEIARVNDFNKFLVAIDSGMQTLIAIKNTYMGRINSNPIERALSIPTISCYFSPPPDVTLIIFLAKANEYNASRAFFETWNNLPRVNAMLGNFQNLHDKINHRNTVLSQLREFYQIDDQGRSVMNIGTLTPEQFKVLKTAVDLTEGVLCLVEGLLKEYYSCLKNIPSAAKLSINEKVTKKHVEVLTYSNPSPQFQKSFSSIPNVDISALAFILGVSEEVAKASFITGYEKVPVVF